MKLYEKRKVRIANIDIFFLGKNKKLEEFDNYKKQMYKIVKSGLRDGEENYVII